MDAPLTRIGRRGFLVRLGAGGAALGSFLIACESGVPRAETPSSAPSAASAAPSALASAVTVRPEIVRLSSVVIPQDSGLYAHLLPDFEKRTGLKVEVTTAQDVYGPALTGKADLILSHYQHEGLLPFAQEGAGEFPRMVFASPIALIGPSGDPAGIRGAADVLDAFTRIDRSGKPFIVNDQDGLRYVAEVSRRAADLAPTDRHVDKGTRGPDAMRAAAQAGGYTMWGLVPFLRMKQQQAQLPLEALFMRDQLLKSVMVTTVVSAKKVAGVNVAGARSLQQYLAEPATQARIRTFRMTGVADPVWWPAAHDNESTFAKP